MYWSYPKALTHMMQRRSAAYSPRSREFAECCSLIRSLCGDKSKPARSNATTHTYLNHNYSSVGTANYKIILILSPRDDDRAEQDVPCTTIDNMITLQTSCIRDKTAVPVCCTERVKGAATQPLLAGATRITKTRRPNGAQESHADSDQGPGLCLHACSLVNNMRRRLSPWAHLIHRHCIAAVLLIFARCCRLADVLMG